MSKNAVYGAFTNHGSYAYSVIRHKIMHFELPPGSIINEGELAEELQVSRTPVHEAVLRLRDEFLIDVIPRKESRVSKISIPLVNEGLFFRLCIEPEIFLLATEHVSPFFLQKMQENLNKQKEIMDSGENLPMYHELDDEFHRMTYEITDRLHTYNCVQRMVTHLDRIRALVRVMEENDIEKSSYSEHKAMMGLLTYGKPLDCEIHEFLRRHICRYQGKMDLYVEQFPDYFSFSAHS